MILAVGFRHHRLTAKRQLSPARWVFQCDCGNEVTLYAAQLRGTRKSCGCQKRDTLVARNIKHGMSKHPLYHMWNGMKARCNDANHEGFHNYGGRGIKVCERWLSFENFVADMGPRPADTTLDRKHSDRDYEPSNCRWATHREQSENTRRNQFLEIDGERLTISQWSRRLGIDQRTLNRRRALGWSDEAIIKTPIGGAACSY